MMRPALALDASAGAPDAADGSPRIPADALARPSGAPGAHRRSCDAPPADWLTRYVALVRRLRFLIVLLWLLVFVVGLVAVGRVFANLKLQVDPIRGDANDVAETALRAAFPRVARLQTTTALLRCAGGCAGSAAARDAAARLYDAAAPYIADGLLTASSGASVFTYADAGLASSAASKLSADGTATLIQFHSTQAAAITPAFRAMLADLRAAMADALAAAPPGELEGDFTGALVINADSSAAIAKDIAASDGVTVSISVLLLAAALRSLRLVLLTGAALAAAFGGTFLLTWPLTNAMSTPNFVTSLLISTLVSLCLDYSLFLLSSLKASLSRAVPVADAIEAMLRSSGHTVLVSGATLAACFLVLGIFPVSIVRAPGIATTFAVVMSVLVNLSLTPALVFIFPRFFGGAPLFGGCGCCGAERAVVPLSAAAADVSVALACEPAMAPRKKAAAAAEEEEPSGAPAGRVARAWAALARATMTHRWALALGLTALLVAPFAYRLPHFAVSQSVRNVLPRHAGAAETLFQLQEAFGQGSTSLVRLLGVPAATSAAPGAALTPQFFASAAAAVTATLGASSSEELTAADVAGLAWLSGAPADAPTVAAYLAATSACPGDSVAACRAACPAAACALRLLSNSTLSAAGDAMILTLGLRIDRASDAGVAWTRAVRAALDAVNAADATATWHLLVDATPDGIAYIYDRFGQLVGITAAVVFCILLFAFRSVAIAVRSLATLAVMEVCVFGAATAIYCQGALNPGGVIGTFSGENGLYWLMPILSFSLITGLGLDYDIFVVSNIVEERKAGWSDTDAVAVGVQRSGPVISWAGIIMAVAFSGFLFSHIPLLNQLGFFVVFAVLVDTFVVRPLLVPAMMNILGRANYWPAAMPAPTRLPLQLAPADGKPGDVAGAHGGVEGSGV